MHASRPEPAVAPSASSLPGPYPVGVYAAQLKQRLQQFARVSLVGEVWGVKAARARVYFELRDGSGALPCSMWRADFEALRLTLTDGMRVVAGGGCDYYPGSTTASPSFSFAVSELRPAGEGDLLARLGHLRRRLDAEGLFEPQKRLVRPRLPRAIGVVCGERGKARDDVLAGLRRRGWGGCLVWAFVSVQDRRAAPEIAAALRELAAVAEVEVVIVARGGGSLADLQAFCDEGLCRTVALLRVPVICSVGHHTDRTLLDDVAAVSCSTPTHAAETAVPVDCRVARGQLAEAAHRLHAHGRRAIGTRALALRHLVRGPAEQVTRHRRRLHQLARELRAAGRRGAQRRRQASEAHSGALARTAARSSGAERERARRELERLALALAAHDPDRTLARGYALALNREGEPVGSALAARREAELGLRFHDGTVDVEVSREP